MVTVGALLQFYASSSRRFIILFFMLYEMSETDLLENVLHISVKMIGARGIIPYAMCVL
jgi:hypothetical protein